MVNIVKKLTKYGTYVVMVVLLVQLSYIAMQLARYSCQSMPGFSQYIARLFSGAVRRQRGNHLEIPYEWLSVQILYVFGLCGMITSDFNDSIGWIKIFRKNRLYWWNQKVLALFLYSTEFFIVLYGLTGLFAFFLGERGRTYSQIWIQDYGNHSVFRYSIICQIILEYMICFLMGLFHLVLEMYTRSAFSVFISLSLILLSIFPDVCRYSFFQLTMFSWNYERLCIIEAGQRVLFGILFPACITGGIIFVLYFLGRKKGSKIEFY